MGHSFNVIHHLQVPTVMHPPLGWPDSFSSPWNSWAGTFLATSCPKAEKPAPSTQCAALTASELRSSPMPESQQRNRTSHTSGIVLETYVFLIVHFLRGVRPMFALKKVNKRSLCHLCWPPSSWRSFGVLPRCVASRQLRTSKMAHADTAWLELTSATWNWKKTGWYLLAITVNVAMENGL